MFLCTHATGALLGATGLLTGAYSDDGRYVVVVEHDLSVLDYLSDFICCLYGKPGAYGVVSDQTLV